MVQKIEEIIFPDNYDIKQTQLSIDKGDTIILKVDQEKIEFDIAAQCVKQMANLYPDNPILMLFDGITIEVIRNELDYSVNFSYNKKNENKLKWCCRLVCLYIFYNIFI